MYADMSCITWIANITYVSITVCTLVGQSMRHREKMKYGYMAREMIIRSVSTYTLYNRSFWQGDLRKINADSPVTQNIASTLA